MLSFTTVILLPLTETVAQSSDYRLRNLENTVMQLQDALIRARAEIDELKKERAKDNKSKVKVSTTGGGVKVKHKDGSSFSMNGRIMIDYDNYDGVLFDGGKSDESSSEGEFRRTRLAAKGSIKKDWKYVFALNIDDQTDSADVNTAYIEYAGFKPLYWRVGKFNEPFSLERLTSSKWLSTIERSLLTEAMDERTELRSVDERVLGGKKSLGSGKPDFAGVAVSGYHEEFSHLNWSLGVFDDGVEGAGGSDKYGYTGRIAFVPHFDNNHFLHLGAAYSIRDLDGVGYTVRTRFGVHEAVKVTLSGSESIGDVDQLGLEAAYVIGPFSVQGEYIDVSMDGEAFVRDDPEDSNNTITTTTGEDLDFDGYYLQAAYTLTGETRGYKTEGAVFDKISPKGAYGAWELVGRYETLETEGGDNQDAEAERWVLGMNWYINNNVKLMANYVDAEINNLDVNVDDGDAFSLRAQYVW